MNTYKTIDSKSEGIFKDKGSKFISFAIPISNVNDVKDILNQKKKEFYDARHICYAYVIGKEYIESKVNDDGEPSGTAGKPILGQIKSNNLTDILVIVVRYFGGILLGTGGLIKAYKAAALDAISNSIIVEKSININISIQFGYDQLNLVMRIIKDNCLNIQQQHLDMNCKMTLEVQQQFSEKIHGDLLKINNMTITKIE